MRKNNMKVSTKLLLGFGSVIGLVCMIAGVGFAKLRALDAEVQLMVNDRYPKTVWANEIIKQIDEIALAMRNALLLKDKEAIAKEIERIQASRKVILDDFERLKNSITTEKGKVALQKALSARTN